VSGRASVDAALLEGALADLQAKGRVLLPISVEVWDKAGVVALSAQVEWFISLTDAVTSV
jgi:hypothetical protein